jgi:transcriptional regulator with XRE-family HTH domain
MVSTLSQRLQEVRTLLGLSAHEMAARVGLRDRKSWERYERGETGPKAEVLTELADLGIDCHWILTGEGAMLRAGTEGLTTLPRIKSAGPGRPRRRVAAKAGDPLGSEGRPVMPSLLSESSSNGLVTPPSSAPEPSPDEGSLSPEESQDLAIRRAFVRDETLLAMLIEGIVSMHEEEGLTLTPRELGRHTARIYADLVRAYALPEERIVGVRALLYQLRASLAPGSSGLISPPPPLPSPSTEPET